MTRAGTALLAAAAALAACQPQAGGAPVPDGLRFALERTACHGTCPVYRVEVDSDGTVTWEGKRFVKVQGPATATIPRDSVAALYAEFERAQFAAMPDSLTFGSPACPQVIADLPSAIVTFARTGMVKVVRHDQGCGGAPDALRRLEERLDAVAGTARWIGTDAERTAADGPVR